MKKPPVARQFLAPGLLLLAALGACRPPEVREPDPTATLPAATDTRCAKPGTVDAALFGAVETEIHWTAATMSCDNMLRPNDEGIRLRFAGSVAGEQLAIIIAIPGLKAGETAAELPSNVTATIEGRGRFFSTPDLNSCWTDVTAQTMLPERAESYILSGTLYCVNALGEINGDAAISIPELSFTTTIDWSKT